MEDHINIRLYDYDQVLIFTVWAGKISQEPFSNTLHIFCMARAPERWQVVTREKLVLDDIKCPLKTHEEAAKSIATSEFQAIWRIAIWRESARWYWNQQLINSLGKRVSSIVVFPSWQKVKDRPSYFWSSLQICSVINVYSECLYWRLFVYVLSSDESHWKQSNKTRKNLMKKHIKNFSGVKVPIYRNLI